MAASVAAEGSVNDTIEQRQETPSFKIVLDRHLKTGIFLLEIHVYFLTF